MSKENISYVYDKRLISPNCLLNLKPADIDSKRGILLIKQAKGKKDRIAPISAKTIEMLRDYYKAYKPQTWLFEGQTKGEQCTAERMQ